MGTLIRTAGSPRWVTPDTRCLICRRETSSGRSSGELHRLSLSTFHACPDDPPYWSCLRRLKTHQSYISLIRTISEHSGAFFTKQPTQTNTPERPDRRLMPRGTAATARVDEASVIRADVTAYLTV